MEAARPEGRRQRTRRGTVERPLNTRLVRVAAIVVAPAILTVLFSISATGTLPRPPLEPVFDGEAAAELATDFASENPSRIPGTPEADDAALWYSETLSLLRLTTEEDVWEADVPELGRVQLRNFVTVVPGQSQEAIIVVAHRDNAGVGRKLGDNASGTAALVELARGYAPQEGAPPPLPRRTLVLVSTDAGAYGGAGIRRFVDVSPHVPSAIAAVVLDGIGGRGRPRLAVAGDGSSSASRVLVSTSRARIEEEFRASPLLPSVAAQLVDLGIPFAYGEQGALLGDDVAAVTITVEEPGDPEVPAGDPAAGGAGGIAVERLTRLGRATDALIGSIDASARGVFRTHDTLFLDDRAASGWTIRLTLIVAIVPFVLGVLDLLVRARRIAVPLRPAVRALRSRFLYWLYAGLLVWLAGVAGVLPTGDALPLPPYAELVEDAPFAGLALMVLALALGWLVLRRRIAPPYDATAEERLAGYSAALAGLAVVAVVIALVQPYILLFVLPSLYTWLWLPLAGRTRSRVAAFLAGLVVPAAGLLVLAAELDLGPFDVLLYALGLVTVGYVSSVTVVLWLAWAAVAAQFAALALGRYVPYMHGAEPPPPGFVRASLARLARYGRRR
jgi:Peptidase family M28